VLFQLDQAAVARGRRCAREPNGGRSERRRGVAMLGKAQCCFAKQKSTIKAVGC